MRGRGRSVGERDGNCAPCEWAGRARGEGDQKRAIGTCPASAGASPGGRSGSTRANEERGRSLCTTRREASVQPPPRMHNAAKNLQGRSSLQRAHLLPPHLSIAAMASEAHRKGETRCRGPRAAATTLQLSTQPRSASPLCQHSASSGEDGEARAAQELRPAPPSTLHAHGRGPACCVRCSSASSSSCRLPHRASRETGDCRSSKEIEDFPSVAGSGGGPGSTPAHNPDELIQYQKHTHERWPHVKMRAQERIMSIGCRPCEQSEQSTGSACL